MSDIFNSFTDDIFNSFDDDLFVFDNTNIFDDINDDKINDSFKKYMESNVSSIDKRLFLKLKKEYYRIKNIDNYHDIQNKIYKNKDKKEIVSFEIKRILNNSKDDEKVLEEVRDIKKLISLLDGENFSDDLYNKIISLIIKIEVSLGMNVGLFDELCNLFEKMILDIENGNVTDYVKKRINGE